MKVNDVVHVHDFSVSKYSVDGCSFMYGNLHGKYQNDSAPSSPVPFHW